MTEMIVIVEDIGDVLLTESDDVVREIAEEGIPGRGVVSAVINGAGHLIVTYTDGTTSDAGAILGAGLVPFIHIQNVPATVWTPIVHGLNREIVHATIYSLDFSVQWLGSTVQPLDVNTCRISHDETISGIALIE